MPKAVRSTILKAQDRLCEVRELVELILMACDRDLGPIARAALDAADKMKQVRDMLDEAEETAQ